MPEKQQANSGTAKQGHDVPVGLRIVQLLFLLSALFSFLAAATLLTEYAAIFGVVKLVIAAALVFIVFGINKKQKWSFALGMALVVFSLASNIIPNFNWAGLVLNAVLFVLLFIEKPYFTE